MNILFVHEVDWIKKVAFEIHNLAEALSLRGHRVYAIDYEDTWKRGGFPGLGTLKTREFDAVSRVFPGSHVDLRRPGFIRLPVLSRLSAGFTHYFEIKRTIEEKKIDVIVLYSVPTNGLQTVRLARRCGIPVAFRSIDILHKLVRYRVLRSPTRLLEKRVYSGVDLILAITPNHARYVISMGADEAKVKLLLLPIDTDLFRPLEPDSGLREKWGISETDSVIVFIGTLFKFSGLDGFIQEFHRVLREFPAAKLLIVGDGPQRPRLERIIDAQGLGGEVIITGFQPYETMPRYISLASVCVNPFINTYNTREIFPGKIIQYLACARATVATPLLGITALVKDESGGVAYADSPSDMAAQVVDLLKSPGRREQLGRAGLEYVRRTHDQQVIARQLESDLLELTGAPATVSTRRRI
jgi:glycosyltransferase involved in cell wall biosynthesis